MARNKLDPEIKVELLIKLAFGISITELAKEYQLTEAKIINLRKNNYLLYNEFFDYWKIDPAVAILDLTPKHERAISIIKKFYKNKVILNKDGSILYKNKRYCMKEIFLLADSILKKDNINNFIDLPINVKNYY